MFLASSSLKRHQYKCCSIAVRLPIPLLQAEGIEVIYPRLSVPRHLLPEVTRVTWNISDNAELFKPFRYGVRSPCGTDRQTDGRTNSNADSFPYNAGAEASNTRNRGVIWPTLMITVHRCSDNGISPPQCTIDFNSLQFMTSVVLWDRFWCPEHVVELSLQHFVLICRFSRAVVYAHPFPQVSLFTVLYCNGLLGPTIYFKTIYLKQLLLKSAKSIVSVISILRPADLSFSLRHRAANTRSQFPWHHIQRRCPPPDVTQSPPSHPLSR